MPDDQISSVFPDQTSSQPTGNTFSHPVGYPVRDKIRAIRNEGDLLTLNFDSKASTRLSTRWLRLACNCEVCGDTQSGKRWLTPADVPASVRAENIDISTPGEVTVVWDDGHVSHYDAGFIARHCEGATRFQPKLWAKLCGGDLNGSIGKFSYEAVVGADEALFGSLRALRDHGVMMLTGVPTEAEDTMRIAERFGPIRETSYGKVFDLISKPEARVAGETARAQIPHTDEPFRYSPPGFIFFHAIKTGAHMGGTSLMVDGFHIAELMRTQTPDLFEILSRHGVTFHREHAGEVFFSTEAHVISLDSKGQVTGIRFNDRCLAPQEAPEGLIDPLIDALAEFTRLVCLPENQFQHQVQPGEMLVFDNQRILHGRSAFDPTIAERHLRSCNIDRDAVHSAFRMLARRFAPDEAEQVLYQGAIL
ncbi:MAG: TauD/TfdA family dioxygenase [Halopseudomonas aestusnigri]